jgi:hypothetical protein
MPLKISVIKKKFPALFSELCPSVSHLFGGGVRNPAGGGPEGVAERGELVENIATVVGNMRFREAARRIDEAGWARASDVSGLIVAIVVVGEVEDLGAAVAVEAVQLQLDGGHWSRGNESTTF